jgi:hypothetical protein
LNSPEGAVPEAWAALEAGCADEAIEEMIANRLTEKTTNITR